jgi:DNA gyrase subunit A
METSDRPHKLPVNIEDEMRQSYMDYAMSVIVGRALPDARDGLKPVHRRAFYSMYDLNNDWNRPYKKSARIVGDVIGKYHPHGDAAVYDTIVRLAQDFSMRYPLVDGQGNFGSVDGDPPAAMRYTEIRLQRLAGELLADIDKETVDFVPNYDDTLSEPSVLPARLPNLLVNGSSGIAVGMATNIPPHNLSEVADALIALIDNPQLTVADLMRFIPGPDFPTAGFVCGREPIREAYETGKGILQVRGRTFMESDERTGRTSIIVNEIPYQVNKTRLIERIAELVNERRIEGVSDLRDESDREGMRIVVELRRDADADVVLNQLFKLTPMQESFGVIMLAIVDGRPRLLSLKDALQVFLEHRKEVITRRTVFELRKAEERRHVLEGLRTAIEHLDAVLELIRKAPDVATARRGLQQQFQMSEIQAQAVLDMRLQRLTSLERDKILEEHKQTLELIDRLQKILADEREVMKLVAEGLRELKASYGDARRTEIVDAAAEISLEDMIAEEDMVVTVSYQGYIKRNAVGLYRAQRRGGRGKVGASVRDADFIANLFVASTHSYLLFFTTVGRVYWRKVHEIPQAGRATRGKAIVNLLNLGPGERVSAFLPVREFKEGHYVVFSTSRGLIKKTDLMAYSNPRPSGIIAIALEEGDGVIGVRMTDGTQELILSTRGGQAIRFREGDVRPMGRDTYGVKGITLEQGDEVVAMDVLAPGASLLAVSERGYGKRSAMGDYRLQTRGGKGIITMRTTEKTGTVAGVLMVTDEDQVILVTDRGKVIRIRMGEIRVIGRNTQGVRLIDLEDEERVSSVARLAEREDEKEEASDPSDEETVESSETIGSDNGTSESSNGTSEEP